jgi:hypothetical protein
MIRYFITQWGYLIEVELNPCGCCPHSLIVEWGKRYTQSASYNFNNDFEIEEKLSKWTELL